MKPVDGMPEDITYVARSDFEALFAPLNHEKYAAYYDRSHVTGNFEGLGQWLFNNTPKAGSGRACLTNSFAIKALAGAPAPLRTESETVLRDISRMQEAGFHINLRVLRDSGDVYHQNRMGPNMYRGSMYCLHADKTPDASPDDRRAIMNYSNKGGTEIARLSDVFAAAQDPRIARKNTKINPDAPSNKHAYINRVYVPREKDSPIFRTGVGLLVFATTPALPSLPHRSGRFGKNPETGEDGYRLVLLGQKSTPRYGA